MSDPTLAAMDEMRRVCSGEAAMPVPPPLPRPLVEDGCSGKGLSTTAVDRSGGIVGGGGNTDNANKASRNYIGSPNCDTFVMGRGSGVDWGYTAIVALLASLVGSLVYLLGCP